MQPKMIYDPIHGNIELSELESEILKTSIFNRLHQVLQNSTAYLVFPSCKTSRFEHSLGVMNYSSDLFINGLKNATYKKATTDSPKVDVKLDYINDKFYVIKNLLLEDPQIIESYHNDNIKEKDQPFYLETYLDRNYNIKKSNLDQLLENDGIIDKLSEEIEEMLGHNFVLKKLGMYENALSHKQKFTLLLLFQTLRIYGLLHDIGHLPFSHVFEFSIEAIKESSIMDSLSTIALSNDQQKLKERIREIVGDQNDEQIHEGVGKKITHLLLQKLQTNLFEQHSDLSEDSIVLRVLILLLIELSYDEIRKQHEMSRLVSLYEIVSGSIDADRLDFVQRDGYVSGISKASGNLDRIIKMFKLSKVHEGFYDNYRFLPTFQSLHDIEKLLQDRFNIYKYMVNHHAVKRSDYILQKNIEYLFFTEFNKAGNNLKDEDPNTFIGIINIIHDLLKDEKRSFYIKLNSLSKLTDYRLLSIFASKYLNYINLLKDPSFQFDKEIDYLSEIYESKRGFISLWKRIYNYEDFLLDLATHCLENKIFITINYDDLQIKINNNVKYFKVVEKYKEYRNIIKESEQVTISIIQKKTIAKFILEVLFLQNERLWTRKIEITAQSKITEVPDLDILVIRTNITNGILKVQYDEKENKYLYSSKLLLVDGKNEEKMLKFEEMSLLPKSLLNEEENAIKFFVYYKQNNGSDYHDFVKNTIINAISDEVVKINSTFATLKK